MQKGSTFVLYSLGRRFLSTSTLRMASNGHKILTIDNINPNVLTMEYAVRGPLVIRAVELEKELANVGIFYTKFIYKSSL